MIYINGNDLTIILKGLQKFYEQIYQGILRHLHFDIVKAVIIASPGFVKDQLYAYIFDQAVVSYSRWLFMNVETHSFDIENGQ